MSSSARRLATSPASTSSRLGAVDRPEECLLGRLGGVGRIADFMARGAEWRDEHGGGSLHGELPVSVWGTPFSSGLPQAQEDEEPAALPGLAVTSMTAGERTPSIRPRNRA
jgi:hypothetical protein